MMEDGSVQFDFGDRMEDGGEEYEQTRTNRKQMLADRAFRVEVLRWLYDAGPRGEKMDRLMKVGIERGWWQDTVSKHHGEKMRMAWSFGLHVVTTHCGSTSTKTMFVVHPAFIRIEFEHEMYNRDRLRMIRSLKTFNWVKVQSWFADGAG